MAKKSSRKIHLVAGINDEAFVRFCRRMVLLEDEAKTPIIVELSSPGGNAYDALAFAGRIRNSPCDVVIRAYGLIASAAVVILAAGDSRLMAKEAWVMVHEDSAEFSGNVTDFRKFSGNMSRLEDQWADLLGDLTSTSAKKWRELHHQETWLMAVECLKLGLIDEVF